ncbi:hypothetical protein ACFXQA_01300 [Microbacterium sp. P07]|uniref:hypothetical protein n=1 Tax=Microbacterium sp. P07 TaxID=3366952 RepID=UPI003744DD95
MGELLLATGMTLVTTDAVGAVVVEYAALLAAGVASDVIRIPVVVSGGVRMCDVLLQPTAAIAHIMDGSFETKIEGSDMAVEDIHNRMRAESGG